MERQVTFVTFNTFDYILMISYCVSIVVVTVYTWFLSAIKKYNIVAWERSDKLLGWLFLLFFVVAFLRILVFPISYRGEQSDAVAVIIGTHTLLLFWGILIPPEKTNSFIRKIFRNHEALLRERRKTLYAIISLSLLIDIIGILLSVFVITYTYLTKKNPLRIIMPPHDLLFLAILIVLLPLINALRLYPLTPCAKMFSEDAKAKILEYFETIGVLTYKLLTSKYRVLRLLEAVSNAREIIRHPAAYLNIGEKNNILITETMAINLKGLSRILTKNLKDAKTDREKIAIIVQLLSSIIDETGIEDVHDVRVLLLAMLKISRILP